VCFGLNNQDLEQLVLDQHSQLLMKDSYVRDLEDYIDNLLVKVMETHPKILQNPYVRPSGNNNCMASSSATVNGLPSSATLPPGVYVANQLNKSTAGSDTNPFTSSKTKSRKVRGNRRIELLQIFSRMS